MGKYLKQLSNEEIQNFLRDNKYELNENIKSNENEKLPSIERSEDFVFMRCKRILSKEEEELDKQLAYTLMHKYPGFLTLSMFATINVYSLDTDIVTLTDFNANIISANMDREENVEILDENYVNFMARKFGKEYIRDYLEDSKKYNSNQPTEDNNMEM